MEVEAPIRHRVEGKVQRCYGFEDGVSPNYAGELTMRDDFQFVEFSMYLIGAALMAALAKALQSHFGVIALTVAIAALAPLPVWIYRLRCTLPKRLELILLYDAAVMLCLGLVASMAGAAFVFTRWLT